MRNEMNKNKQYVPAAGDRVKLVELHKSDAHYLKEKPNALIGEVFIINEIGQRTTEIRNELFPFVYARAHVEKSGKVYSFYAAKFLPAPKFLEFIKKLIGKKDGHKTN